MAISYKVKKVKNPNGVADKDYFAAKAVKSSDYTFEELAEDINSATTVTLADAYAVLKSMKKYIKAALLAGRRVVLSDLGAFKISLRGKCFSQETMSDKDFQPSSYIKEVNVSFRPEAKLIKEIRSEKSLKRIASEEMP